MGFVTHIIWKVIVHAGVQGNELADAAAKIVITNKDLIRRRASKQGGVSHSGSNPTIWLMYKVTPSPDPAVMCSGLESASLCPCSWKSLQPKMPLGAPGHQSRGPRNSSDFRKHTRIRAVLASLRQTSVYSRRLMLGASDERGPS